MQLFSLPVRIGKTDFPWGWQNTHLTVTSKIYKKPLKIKLKCSRREPKGASQAGREQERLWRRLQLLFWAKNGETKKYKKSG
jgi:hypothetical protein